MMSEPRFFKTAAIFRRWLKRNHENELELLVGFHKVGSGKPSMTWPESVEQALCFGWIDGIRRSLDEHSYTIRFTPRKRTSTWSNVNIKKALELIDAGLMMEAGLRAFEARLENKSGNYSYEQRSVELVEPYGTALRKNKKANAFFEAQSNTYRKAVSWWILAAKQDATRLRRLELLIECCLAGKRIPQFVSNKS
ncbi:MAG: YdeI/OmpD-associated family protein [Pirellulales bacterium]